MSTDAKRRLAAAGFVALLALSVFWPEPVVDINRLCCNAPIGVDELSFLGREAPRWDVVFWCLAGLFAIALMHSAGERRDYTLPRPHAALAPVPLVVSIVVAAAAVAVVWRVADAPITAWAERIQSDAVQDWIRIANRFGGGMNPAMIILFFYLAGVAYSVPRWKQYALSMTIAGAGGGLLAQIIKYTAGRTRPELWLGPFQHARASATSFPSGHTVGAFALAGVLLFTSPSRVLRIIAVVLAFGVGISRILAFRHWTSDVVASAALGLITAWIVSQLTKAPPPTA
ncbi:MAG TPA: phosphatase PAP2 family protein [Thermoanaerobaculia bacterium]|nr:phosphatase PAP2 family protein [Thermoanaerobaculia bacterium]